MNAIVPLMDGSCLECPTSTKDEACEGGKVEAGGSRGREIQAVGSGKGGGKCSCISYPLYREFSYFG